MSIEEFGLLYTALVYLNTWRIYGFNLYAYFTTWVLTLHFITMIRIVHYKCKTELDRKLLITSWILGWIVVVMFWFYIFPLVDHSKLPPPLHYVSTHGGVHIFIVVLFIKTDFSVYIYDYMWSIYYSSIYLLLVLWPLKYFGVTIYPIILEQIIPTLVIFITNDMMIMLAFYVGAAVKEKTSDFIISYFNKVKVAIPGLVFGFACLIWFPLQKFSLRFMISFTTWCLILHILILFFIVIGKKDSRFVRVLLLIGWPVGWVVTIMFWVYIFPFVDKSVLPPSWQYIGCHGGINLIISYEFITSSIQANIYDFKYSVCFCLVYLVLFAIPLRFFGIIIYPMMLEQAIPTVLIFIATFIVLVGSFFVGVRLLSRNKVKNS
ncbi:hypothetical protein SteCoe_1563 [Stentor coeruleus]|uniref:Uncharacterized protein n=1 Tax=Stentor coeruleus TaxID=5963 RepID=A0A1R2D1P3_9CILI|nr:hypothetical protein SteCoe_1563 [Stentor coeruleus]